jgi:hypothetical protein
LYSFYFAFAIIVMGFTEKVECVLGAAAYIPLTAPTGSAGLGLRYTTNFVFTFLLNAKWSLK